MKDLTERKLVYLDDAIDAVCMEWCNVKHQDCKHPFDDEKDDYYWCDGCETVLRTLPDLPPAQPTEASCWGCNCQKMERLKERKTFSEMVHLHDAERRENG